MNSLRLPLPIIVGMIAALATGCGPTQRDERECVANMKQVWSAAISCSLENKINQQALIPTSDYFDFLKGSILPLCPLGTNVYQSFVVVQGPRCPNSAQHTAVLMTEACAYNRAFAWDLAISYAHEKKLPWDSTIGPKEISDQLQRDMDKLRVAYGALKAPWINCPLSTNDYPAFVLRDGPRCPYDEHHNQVKWRVRMNSTYFDQHHNILPDVHW